jgi:hypothetical protein
LACIFVKYNLILWGNQNFGLYGPANLQGKKLKVSRFHGVLICQRGLIPRRTTSCLVSDLAEQNPAGIRPHGTQSCGVSDPAEQWQSCVHFIADTCSARFDTPQNNILRGLIPHLTKFCGVSDPGEQSSAQYQTPQNNI